MNVCRRGPPAESAINSQVGVGFPAIGIGAPGHRCFDLGNGARSDNGSGISRPAKSHSLFDALHFVRVDVRKGQIDIGHARFRGCCLFQKTSYGWNVQFTQLHQLHSRTCPKLRVGQRVDEKISAARITREACENAAIVRGPRKFSLSRVRDFEIVTCLHERRPKRGKFRLWRFAHVHPESFRLSSTEVVH